MIFYEVTWETSSILKSIVSFVNVSARPVFFPAFCPPRLSFHDNVFVLHLFFFPRPLENFILYFSRTFKWPFTLQRDVIFSNAPLFSTAACPLNVDKFAMPARARVEEKGFSCLEENVLRTVTIEMIGKFLPPLSTLLPYLLAPFPSAFATRHELLRRGIALINVSQPIRRRTKFLCMFASIAKVLWRFDSNML